MFFYKNGIKGVRKEIEREQKLGFKEVLIERWGFNWVLEILGFGFCVFEFGDGLDCILVFMTATYFDSSMSLKHAPSFQLS